MSESYSIGETIEVAASERNLNAANVALNTLVNIALSMHEDAGTRIAAAVAILDRVGVHGER